MQGCNLNYSDGYGFGRTFDGYGIGKQLEGWDGFLPKEEGCNV